jgi:hypothetical protein
VWTYLEGRWQAASVRAECRGGDGWSWCWVSLETGFAWVLQVRTVERAPSPADQKWARRIWAREPEGSTSPQVAPGVSPATVTLSRGPTTP